MKRRPVQSYARKLERNKRLVSRLFLLAGLAVLLLLVFFTVGAAISGAAGATLVAVAALLYILGDKLFAWSDRAHASANRASKGVKAEEEVRAILAGLCGDEYFVAHDIPSPAGNIDHLVVAHHGGIFVIETKSSKGRVETKGDQLLLNGQPMPGDPVRQTLRNAMWVKDKAREAVAEEPYITAILLFTDAYIVTMEPVRGSSFPDLSSFTGSLRHRRPRRLKARRYGQTGSGYRRALPRVLPRRETDARWNECRPLGLWERAAHSKWGRSGLDRVSGTAQLDTGRRPERSRLTEREPPWRERLSRPTQTAHASQILVPAG